MKRSALLGGAARDFAPSDRTPSGRRRSAPYYTPAAKELLRRALERRAVASGSSKRAVVRSALLHTAQWEALERAIATEGRTIAARAALNVLSYHRARFAGASRISESDLRSILRPLDVQAGTLCENLARVTPSASMSSETSVAHACDVLITSRGTASLPAVVVPVDMLAL